MSNAASTPAVKLLRFGVFELDLRTGELRKSGVKLRIQEQPVQILGILLQRPRELVTREELVKILWPEGTFVDYDHSLNTAVNKLRETLGDSANTPRFIETLPRRGYRFIAEVTSEFPPAADAAALHLPASPAPEAFMEDLLPAVPRGLARTLFLAAQLMYLGFYVAALTQMDGVQNLLLPVFPGYAGMVAALVLVTAMVGIPVRFFLLTAVGFDYSRFREKYDRIFFLVLLLDELWGLAPLLMSPKIGFGLALATVAALLYLPFGQRTLVQMAYPKAASAR